MYEKLFETGMIGPLKLKNRVIMTAAGCEMAHEDGTIPEEYIAYYEARAKGGVGAIITELVQVNGVTGVMNSHQVRMHSDDCIEQLRPLADRVHQYDCKIFLQFQHPGNVTTPEKLNGNIPVSASNISNLIFPQEVRPMTTDEIHELVEQFADAAYRAKQAGIDGVEIHAAHFYLIHQFLTPYFNKRTDEYGGSRENRVRILKEIIAKTKKKCGKDYPVIVRISVEEFFPKGGYHLNEGIEICKLVEQYGADAINVTCAGTGCRYGQSLEPISYQQGWRQHLPAAVKKFVNIPVIGVATVREPEFAEKMLAQGKMDFVGSARCHLADPEWTNKAKAGQDQDIRKCISCLKCIQGVVQGTGIGCSVNPECGKETIKNTVKADGGNRKVVVAGGGPAGMEAAVAAAKRGFDVALFEKKEYLGGQVYLAAQAPNKDKMYWFIDYQIRQMKKAGVKVHTGIEITMEMLEEEHPYAIIDATGAAPVIPGFVDADKDFVYTPDVVLSGQTDIRDQSVVIVGSGMTGLETAEYLADRNNYVTLIEMDDRIARTAYGTQIADVMKQLETHNVITMVSTALNSIEEGYITVKNTLTEEITCIPADVVVLSLGVRSSKPFGDKLSKICEHVYTIGDAKKSGRIYDAVSSGYEAGITI